jgi:hypothetical protein
MSVTGEIVQKAESGVGTSASYRPVVSIVVKESMNTVVRENITVTVCVVASASSKDRGVVSRHDDEAFAGRSEVSCRGSDQRSSYIWKDNIEHCYTDHQVKVQVVCGKLLKSHCLNLLSLHHGGLCNAAYRVLEAFVYVLCRELCRCVNQKEFIRARSKLAIVPEFAAT